MKEHDELSKSKVPGKAVGGGSPAGASEPLYDAFLDVTPEPTQVEIRQPETLPDEARAFRHPVLLTLELIVIACSGITLVSTIRPQARTPQAISGGETTAGRMFEARAPLVLDLMKQHNGSPGELKSEIERLFVPGIDVYGGN